MRISTLLLSVATLGTTTLAFAAPASAQQYYSHKHYTHARYHHYTHHREGRQIVVHAQEPVVVQSPVYTSLGTRGGGRHPRGWKPPAVGGTLHRRRRGCGQFRGRSAWRHGGALRLPADLRLWRSVRCAVQCGRDSGRSAVPVGGRRFRRAGRRPRLSPPPTEPLAAGPQWTLWPSENMRSHP